MGKLTEDTLRRAVDRYRRDVRRGSLAAVDRVGQRVDADEVTVRHVGQAACDRVDGRCPPDRLGPDPDRCRNDSNVRILIVG